jgi:UDP-GlcNAc:undecaprenyl-phosphate GlcNAc-1-phosphate transferase
MTTARIIGKQPLVELTDGTLIPSFFMLVAVFWYPLFDSLQVYVRRLSRGKSPFVADRSHVHHKLLAATDKNHLLVTAIIVGILLIVLGLGVLAL